MNSLSAAAAFNRFVITRKIDAFILNFPNFILTVPPRISPFNFEEGITEGLRTQLMCSSSQGDQPFNITWLKDQRQIVTRHQKLNQFNGNVDIDIASWRTNQDQTYYVDNSIHINEYAAFSSILSIENLTSSHNGNYTCRISNQGGLVDHTAVLVVAGSYSMCENQIKRTTFSACFSPHTQKSQCQHQIYLSRPHKHNAHSAQIV